MGFLKKVVIADNITLALAYYAPQFGTLSLSERWFFFFLLAMRILMDFSGYSDIAIGLARLLGIKLPENSTGRTRQGAFRSSGRAGTSRSAPGFATTSTFRSGQPFMGW